MTSVPGGTTRRSGSGSRRCLAPSPLAILVLAAVLAAVTATTATAAGDADGNGREDLLDAWLRGECGWDDLRASVEPAAAKAPAPAWPEGAPLPAGGPLERGELRLVCLGQGAAGLARARASAVAAGGRCRLLRRLERFGGVSVLAVDEPGLRAFLQAGPDGRILLDRDGTPALVESRTLAGAELAASGPWGLSGDWTTTVAILDSGCDTAHDDLGDFSQDNIDGPPPAVGHALDWFPADFGWPTFRGYKVVGWHDVTDDFPAAAGPWDYHHHGTALAGIVAGEGTVTAANHGLAPEQRLIIVKFYDFDVVWRQWASDFIAACDWALANRETYRIQTVLCAVNWDVDAGISDAIAALDAAGIVVVAAMGNEGGSTPGYPARLPEVLGVGAVDDDLALAAYSNRGEPGMAKPDLLAPGGGLLPACGRIVTTDNEPNDSYSGRHGTSMAAAHVAGGVALLLEACRREGLPLPATAADAALIRSLLRVTAAPVLVAESSDGEGTVALCRPLAPDRQRGWGSLQAQGAVEAALHGLGTGDRVVAELGGEDGRLVLARRLLAGPGTSCRVTAVPAGGLDISLEVHDSRWLTDPTGGVPPERRDGQGAGGAESIRCRIAGDGFSLVVVKRMAGSGQVTLLVEADTAEEAIAGYAKSVTGDISGWGVTGRFAGAAGAYLLFSSRTDLDPFARLIHALDAQGLEKAGWPAILFVATSGLGNLTAPLAWDLDGTAGDEVFVASEFGRVYRIDPAGVVSATTVAGESVVLSAPVGVTLTGGTREVLVVGSNGGFTRLDAGGAISHGATLGLSAPLAPAVADLVTGGGEEVALATSGGRLTVVSADGATLPGWPRDLGSPLGQPPVLADLDGDGAHEVIQLVADPAGASLAAFRVFEGDGTAGLLDGAATGPPGGGVWRLISPPAVEGTGTDGAPRIVALGLHDNGLSGQVARWRLAEIALDPVGGASARPLDGFEVRVATPPGALQLDWQRLPAPLAWDRKGGAGTDAACFLACRWEEEIPGVTDEAGATLAWFESDPGPPLGTRSSILPGGDLAARPSRIFTALYTPGAGVGDGLARITAAGRKVWAMPVRALHDGPPNWSGQRGDARNSGAYPVVAGPTGIVSRPVGAHLEIYPNPSTAAFQVRWRDVIPGTGALEVYDLRGRLVRRLSVAATADEGGTAWDGRDAHGRLVAAGTYLCVLRHQGGRLVRRAVVAR